MLPGNLRTHIKHGKLSQDGAKFFIKVVLSELDLAHVKLSNAAYLKVFVNNLSAAEDLAWVCMTGIILRTVGVFLWVFERTMSRKSFAVGTGAMALSPLVDIVGRDQGFFSSVPDFQIGE